MSVPSWYFPRASEFFEANLYRLRFSQLGSISAPIKRTKVGRFLELT
jgi:hypothetical protein